MPRTSRSAVSLEAPRRPAWAAALLACGLASLAAPAWATLPWLTPAATCVPDSLHTIQFGVTSKLGGYVRGGREPPYLYFCPVHNPDDKASADWNRLQLQAVDDNLTGGNVVARLYRKSRTTGLVNQVAFVGSLPGPGIQIASKVLLRPFDFAAYGYYIALELNPDGTEQAVEAHMVMLVTE